MFADRYFGKRYFGNRYFGPGGDIVVPVVAVQQPGGGYYHRPIIYLDDQGKPVKLRDHKRRRESEPEIIPPKLAAEILRALLNGPVPEDRSRTLAMMLADAERRLAIVQLEREVARIEAMQADDDLALVLLLS